jgi:hypothetical protein
MSELVAALAGGVLGWALSVATQWITGRRQSLARASETRSRNLARLDKIDRKLHDVEWGRFTSTVTVGEGALEPTDARKVLRDEVNALGKDSDDFYADVIASGVRRLPGDGETYEALRTIVLDHDLRPLEATRRRLSEQLQVPFSPHPPTP